MRIGIVKRGGRSTAVSCSLLVLALGLAGGAAEPGASPEKEVRALALKIMTSAFDANGEIPTKHTCDGDDLSPALTWTGVPEGTRSFAVIMDDPDAPAGTWVHWVIYDLPAETSGLPEGVPRTETLDTGARQGACWGVSSFNRVGYYGPCPPPGSPHHYQFRLYALDAALGLDPRATKTDVLKAMEGHILGKAEVIGTYARH